MDRRHFLSASVTTGLAAALGASTSLNAAPSKPKRVYMVTWRGRTDTEKGFVEYWRSHNAQADFIWRDAGQSRPKLAEFAAEIAAERPDLVYTWGTPPTLGLAGSVAKPHAVIGREIPLVFAAVADPVGANIVASLTTPARNITGVTHVAPVAAQWNGMRAYFETRHVGIIYNRLEPNSVANVDDWNRLAAKQGFKVTAEAFTVRNNAPVADDLEAMIGRLRAAGADWLYLGPDSFLFTQIDRVATLATAAGLRTFASTESHLNAKAPVLTGLVSKFFQVGQFAGAKSLQRLGGELNLPIETLRRFSLIVRKDTMMALGAYPPLALVDYAEFRDG